MNENATDEDLIVALGHAELALSDGTMSDAEYGDVIRAVIARFGEYGMDNLVEYWSRVQAAPDEIMTAETTDPARFVRMARWRPECDVCGSTQEEHKSWCSEGSGPKES